MIIYKNTFDNIKTCNIDFPVEDQYYANDNEGIVADGITRDPIGVPDLDLVTPVEKMKRYPRPSGAQLAAEVIVDTFSKTNSNLKERLIECNKKVKELNQQYIKECDYLESDYYGAVAACAKIDNNILKYSFICDCGVLVLDQSGNIKFQTEDEKLLYSDPYIRTIGIPWNLPESRKTVRSKYRNNLENIQDGKCVSYGALTGEESAINFIRSGEIELQKNDIIAIYSDGFTEFFKLPECIDLMINFDKEKFEQYINSVSANDYEKYGKEKTIILLKNI